MYAIILATSRDDVAKKYGIDAYTLLRRHTNDDGEAEYVEEQVIALPSLDDLLSLIERAGCSVIVGFNEDYKSSLNPTGLFIEVYDYYRE